MNIDTGLAVVIIAVLVFYLRLIILQRERVRQASRALESNTDKKNKRRTSAAVSAPRYSILSSKRRDWVIAGIGVVLIVLGVLAYSRIGAFTTFQPYWWIPTSIGIVAFSWAFRL